jgi:hypothetical protein
MTESGPCEKTLERTLKRVNARRRGRRHSDNVNGAIPLGFAMSTVLSTSHMGNHAATCAEVEPRTRERCPNSPIDDVSLPVGAVGHSGRASGVT